MRTPAGFLIKGPWWDNSVQRGSSLSWSLPFTTTEEESGEGVGSACWLQPLMPQTNFKPGDQSWQEDVLLPRSATHGHTWHCVNVGAQSTAGLSTVTFTCGYICVCGCACGLCYLFNA